ncbi:diguanylate cyclase/phosphodiesterase with PAS/PAC and MHYT sensor [Novosphingobium nitrogenifigens DSM 19370]|uniref:Diguanylate cyclase/phosphodiesterase with PAS/PAC and MHYT sensor n=1 Tax=Novosphingobium nitrogenifigens DSM 19370 TaxID=983920 RepID=F1ZD31_9SPHN|nr:diguanylate cyclase/phosphodiesterase with PAS/PAC and MHYT sensor [Novosphingobium nitrogenifigens DSM 19370]
MDHHQHWLVALAAFICFATAVSGMLLFREASRSGARNWLLAAGGTAGFGIWATHFVAMMGYLPGFEVSYRLWPTVGSLALAVVLITAGFAVALRFPTLVGAALAAAITGSGVAAMHYLGVMAMDMPALVRFDAVYLALSVVLAIAPLIPAFHLARSERHVLPACLLLTLAVVGLHFTGMTAIELVPSRRAASDVILLSQQVMTWLVSVAAGLVVIICLSALAHVRRVQGIVRQGERDMAVIVNGISDCAMFMLTPDGIVKAWNKSAQRLNGYAEADALGLSLERFYAGEGRPSCFACKALDEARHDGRYTGEDWSLRKDGTRFWSHVTIERVIDARERIVGFIVIIRDMTRAREDQERLSETRAHLDTALDNMYQGLALFDASQRLVLHNDRLCELWSLQEGVLRPGMTIAEIVPVMMARAHVDDPGRTRTALESAMSPVAAGTTVIECRADFIVSVATRPLVQGGWVSTFEDITERRRNEARIVHLAMHDPLTGLSNRAHFAEQCAREMDYSARLGQNFALVMIDLNGFKGINDRWGHAEGDRAIVEIGHRLQACCVESETVARLGGDEFAAGKCFASQADLSDFVDRLRACFDDDLAGEGHRIPIGASLGVAVFPSDGADLETLMNNADLAMYRAKNGRGEHICYYQPGMDENARTRRQLATELRHAIERDEFHLVYQPQHAVQSGAVIGYEALLRWVHPKRGLVSPDEFIPIAEETGSIYAIGEWVLREAAREAAQWDPDLKIAVNLSPVQLQQADLVQTITDILVDAGLPPRRLELEITESAIIGDRTRALHLLRQIKALGVGIAMDDFGTGYSSLDTLQAFPFDKIKIDKSFVLKAVSNHQATAIVRAVLALGRSLEIPVLAEGVETEEQLAMLVREGCTEAQGYYYGRPRRLKPEQAPVVTEHG